MSTPILFEILCSDIKCLPIILSYFKTVQNLRFPNTYDTQTNLVFGLGPGIAFLFFGAELLLKQLADGKCSKEKVLKQWDTTHKKH